MLHRHRIGVDGGEWRAVLGAPWAQAEASAFKGHGLGHGTGIACHAPHRNHFSGPVGGNGQGISRLSAHEARSAGDEPLTPSLTRPNWQQRCPAQAVTACRRNVGE
jgi:hypothetical protein